MRTHDTSARGDVRSERPCGCRSYHTKMHGQEVWEFDYCYREVGMSKAMAQLALALVNMSVWNERARA